MNVIYDTAMIRISEVHSQQVSVPRWEIPVLQVIHGNEVVVTGQTIVNRAIPDPASEFKRLADRYGPKNEDVPAVAQIYGNFGPGTTALRNEIRDSLTSADATPSTYRSPEERKLDAEKADSNSGQSIAEEAQAREDAAAANALVNASTTEKPTNGTGEEAVPEFVRPPGAEVIDASESAKPDTTDADIASLI